MMLNDHPAFEATRPSIYSRVRTLLGDPYGRMFTDAIIEPFLSKATDSEYAARAVAAEIADHKGWPEVGKHIREGASR